MKTRTEIILTVLKYLALIAAIGFSIECGSQLFYFIASFINPEWAKNGYNYERSWYQIHQANTWYYICIMSLTISIAAIKAWIWYMVFGLLIKLELQSPFSMFVTKKLESIAWLLLGVWILGTIMTKSYAHYLLKDTGIEMATKFTGDEYFFIAGIVYIISKIFKRGVEIQEENQLTV